MGIMGSKILLQRGRDVSRTQARVLACANLAVIGRHVHTRAQGVTLRRRTTGPGACPANIETDGLLEKHGPRKSLNARQHENVVHPSGRSPPPVQGRH